ncbi:MAG TPA: ComEC/Rec2 family competence protein [Chthoniobacterales bacterium]|nr:ComEC/Rec2 family competence protein [Chthoniobacterales bacterium]
MNVPRQPFVGLALAAGIGIFVADHLPLTVSAWPTAGIVFVLSAALVFIWPRAGLIYFIVSGGFFLLHNFRTGDTPGLRLATELGTRARTIRVTGIVATEPKIAANGLTSFLFNLESIEFEGRAKSSDAALLVHWRGSPEFGDELKLFGVAEPIESPRNPGEFDMRSYLARQDVYRGLFVRYPEDGAVLRKDAGNPVMRAAQKSRSWMQRTICRGLDDSPEVQNFLGGIALGLRHQTTEDIEEPFQQTGTLHLFAVAGLHVGIVAQLLWILAMTARLSRKWATALIIPCLLFYAAVTGLHVSSVRAAVMCSILLAGFFAERKSFALNSLTTAAFFLLCWDTNELFSTGFQLSFVVVGGIVLLADPLARWLQHLGATDPFLPRNLISTSRRAVGIIYGGICRGGSVSIAAWIGSLPLVLRYFHLVTPSSIFANLLVVPLAFFILAIALLSILVAPITLTISVIFNNANWSLASAVIGFVHWSAQLPASHYYVGTPEWPNTNFAKVTVLDLGAGAAVYVHAQGEDWLLDCGSARDYERILRPCLHFAGVNRLDGLMLSHGDSLHIGGAEPLFKDLVPGLLIDSAASDRSAVHRRLREDFFDRRMKVLQLSGGDEFKIAPDVAGKVLFPAPKFTATTADDQALVVQLSAKKTKILFMSDSGYGTELALLRSKFDLRSDILVKGQHHSGKSGLDSFLAAVQPRLIVATSSDFPQHERISDEWADRVHGSGIKLFRQDETGAVELEFGPGAWRAKAYVTGEIFRSDNR